MGHTYAELLGLASDSAVIRELIEFLGPGEYADLLDNQVYFTTQDRCVSLMFEDARLCAIFIRLTEARASGEVMLQLPEGVSAHETYDDIIKRLGVPDLSGGGERQNGLTGPIRPWVKYERGDIAIHVEFDSTGIWPRLVTVMPR